MTITARLRELLESRPLLSDPEDDGLEPAHGALVPAAVLIPITLRPEPGVLLTRRTAHLRKHAGQVAFPGGRIDPGDDGPLGAALREAEEEVGLPRDMVDYVASLPPFRTWTGFVITPVVGLVPADLDLSPHVEEVERIFEVPLSFLLDPTQRNRHEVEHDGIRRHYYEWLWDEFRIWGVTAGIIVNLARRLEGLQ